MPSLVRPVQSMRESLFRHISDLVGISVRLSAIGQKLGGRDHTTVIHSCEKIKHDLKGDNDLEEEITQIRLLLK